MKRIGIYPGNFQPPTRSHFEIYKRLKGLVNGTDIFVVTTDRDPTPEAPFNFGDKEQIWVRHGAQASHIVKVKSLPSDLQQNADSWRPEEIFSKFSNKHTVAIVAMTNKDVKFLSRRKSRENINSNLTSNITELRRELSEPHAKEVWMSSENEPQYYQPYRGNESSLKPFEEHAYVIVMDDGMIQGKPVSTENIREVLGSSNYDEKAKQRFFQWVFGWFDIGLFKLIVTKFRQAYQSSHLVNAKLPSPQTKLEEIVFQILMETLGNEESELTTEYMNSMLTPDSQIEDNGTNTDDSTVDNGDDKNASITSRYQRQQLLDKKRELETQAKQNKEQEKTSSTFVQNYNQNIKKNDRAGLDAINGKLSKY